MSVGVERTGDVLVLTMRNPPVTALSHRLRAELLAAFAHADGAAGVVLTGEPHFSAGADVTDPDPESLFRPPTVHGELAQRLERLAVPVVAAVRGAAMGGGLELALCCGARVVHPDAKVGLPELAFGLIPGAGGTQRLPRAVGIDAAQELILSGATIDGRHAGRIGLADHVDPDPVAAAVELIRTGGRTRLLRDEPVAGATEHLALPPAEDPGERPNVRAAREALRAACSLPFDEGLAVEQRLFRELFASPAAAAARAAFGRS